MAPAPIKHKVSIVDNHGSAGFRGRVCTWNSKKDQKETFRFMKRKTLHIRILANLNSNLETWKYKCAAFRPSNLDICFSFSPSIARPFHGYVFGVFESQKNSKPDFKRNVFLIWEFLRLLKR